MPGLYLNKNPLSHIIDRGFLFILYLAFTYRSCFSSRLSVLHLAIRAIHMLTFWFKERIWLTSSYQ
jgi:hypothetical protein